MTSLYRRPIKFPTNTSASPLGPNRLSSNASTTNITNTKTEGVLSPSAKSLTSQAHALGAVTHGNTTTTSETDLGKQDQHHTAPFVENRRKRQSHQLMPSSSSLATSSSSSSSDSGVAHSGYDTILQGCKDGRWRGEGNERSVRVWPGSPRCRAEG